MLAPVGRSLPFELAGVGRLLQGTCPWRESRAPRGAGGIHAFEGQEAYEG